MVERRTPWDSDEWDRRITAERQGTARHDEGPPRETCGSRRTASGRPCARPVPRPGVACSFHSGRG